MMHFNFFATNKFSANDLNSIERFVEGYPDFQTVTLKSEDELILLLKILGISAIQSEITQSEFYPKLWDLSGYKFPDLDQNKFDLFFQEWLEQSNRNNTMDDYGQLVFLQGIAQRWNLFKHRFIVLEVS